MSTNATMTSSPFGEEQTGVHPSAVGPEPTTLRNESAGTGISTEATQGHQDSQGDPDADYPEQKHAGKVGLGPHYGEKNKETHGIGAKILGIKEEIKGKITRNPELVERGQDRKTGELAQREAEKKEESPFQNDERVKDSTQSVPKKTNTSSFNDVDQTPASDKSARVQASTTHPEGTKRAHKEATEGTELQRDAQLHSVKLTTPF